MSKKTTANDVQTGRYSYAGLDRVLHEKARLGIMTCLVGRANGILFGELKELCSLTDGNLSRHLEVLNESGLIEIWKGFQGKRPQTLVRLSKEGRKRFLQYLAELGKVIRDAIPAAQSEGLKSAKAEKLGPGWIPA